MISNASSRKKLESCKYTGVCFDSCRQKWMAAIKIGKKTLSLGRYDEEKDAAIARDNATRIHFGEYGAYNFPGEIFPDPPRTRRYISPYLGVSFRSWSKDHPWLAAYEKPSTSGRTVIGTFKSEVEAARAYDEYLENILGASPVNARRIGV